MQHIALCAHTTCIRTSCSSFIVIKYLKLNAIGSTMQEYEERLAPSEPFWKLLNEPKAPAPTSAPVNTAQHGALLERSAKMFERSTSGRNIMEQIYITWILTTP